MYTNRKPKGCRLSEARFRKIVECFSLDLTARDTAKLLRLHRHSTEKYYEYFRKKIFEQDKSSKALSGEVEVDESYFGPTRIRGLRGRGAGKKTIVFGILKRNGKVHTWVVQNCKVPTIVPIIDEKVEEGSTIYSDDLGTYRLLFLRYDHRIVYHGKSQFAFKENHINGIESFWAYTKHRVRKFKGIRKERFLLYLKESEWRFNNRSKNLTKELLNIIC